MRVKIAKHRTNVRFSEKQAKHLSRLIRYDVAADAKEGPWRLATNVADLEKPRTPRRARPSRRKGGFARWFLKYYVYRIGLGLIFVYALLVINRAPSDLSLWLSYFFGSSTVSVSGIHFTVCGQPPHNNCVIDGDTFYYQSDSIRIADINTPETSSPSCQYEAELGAQATRRLHELLNEGPFEIVASEWRDEDVYGRKLRTVTRSGTSLGRVLIAEGLAHKWEGRKLSWCG